MNMRIKKQLIVCVLFFAVLSGMIPVVRVSAAKKVSLSVVKLTVTVGKSRTLKVKNTKKKVTWKIVSGKKYISLKKQGKATAVIRGERGGTAKVQAKAGKKNMTCIVVVKKTKKAPDISAPNPVNNPVVTISPISNPLVITGPPEGMQTLPSTSAMPTASTNPEEPTTFPTDKNWVDTRDTSLRVLYLGGNGVRRMSGLGESYEYLGMNQVLVLHGTIEEFSLTDWLPECQMVLSENAKDYEWLTGAEAKSNKALVEKYLPLSCVKDNDNVIFLHGVDGGENYYIVRYFYAQELKYDSDFMCLGISGKYLQSGSQQVLTSDETEFRIYGNLECTVKNLKKIIESSQVYVGEEVASWEYKIVDESVGDDDPYIRLTLKSKTGESRVYDVHYYSYGFDRSNILSVSGEKVKSWSAINNDGDLYLALDKHYTREEEKQILDSLELTFREDGIKYSYSEVEGYEDVHWSLNTVSPDGTNRSVLVAIHEWAEPHCITHVENIAHPSITETNIYGYSSIDLAGTLDVTEENMTRLMDEFVVNISDQKAKYKFAFVMIQSRVALLRLSITDSKGRENNYVVNYRLCDEKYWGDLYIKEIVKTEHIQGASISSSSFAADWIDIYTSLEDTEENREILRKEMKIICGSDEMTYRVGRDEDGHETLILEDKNGRRRRYDVSYYYYEE